MKTTLLYTSFLLGRHGTRGYSLGQTWLWTKAGSCLDKVNCPFLHATFATFLSKENWQFLKARLIPQSNTNISCEAGKGSEGRTGMTMQLISNFYRNL